MSSEGKNEFKNNKKKQKNVKSGVQPLEFYITGKGMESDAETVRIPAGSAGFLQLFDRSMEECAGFRSVEFRMSGSGRKISG